MEREFRVDPREFDFADDQLLVMPCFGQSDKFQVVFQLELAQRESVLLDAVVHLADGVLLESAALGEPFTNRGVMLSECLPGRRWRVEDFADGDDIGASAFRRGAQTA